MPHPKPTSPNGNTDPLPPLSPSPHLAGLILARGGSKGIPLKNLAPLGSRPLITWSLQTMQEFGKFDSIWVSTDHQGIAECAQACGAKIFHRNKENANDTAPSIDAVKEFLVVHKEVDLVCLIQCTSPFIQPDFLESGYKLVMQGYDSVFSCTRDKKLRWSEMKDGNSSTLPVNFDPSNRPRRQDFKGEVVENGMFYFCRRELVEKGLFQGGKCAYVEIPAEYSVDIDSPFDLAFAEQVLSQEYIQLFM